MPWLKLDLKVPEFPSQVLDDAIAATSGWHDQWRDNPIYSSYHNWDGKVLFGPTNWNQWMDLFTASPHKDEDGLSEKYRHEIEFGWRIDLDHPVRKWINSFLDDAAINFVSYYVLGPGGHLPPHYDPCAGKKKCFNKIYAAVTWPADCEFGFLDWGNMPIQQGDVFLISVYQYPHWVINHGDKHRIVLNIACNLTHIQDLIKRSFLRR
jgi:hypothetical protein